MRLRNVILILTGIGLVVAGWYADLKPVPIVCGVLVTLGGTWLHISRFKNRHLYEAPDLD